MAKTNWTMEDIVKPDDLNQLGEEINEALDIANDAETPQGAQTKADAAEQSAKDYADTKINGIPAPAYPVTSVNGQTGDVELTATDVGAETPIGAQAKANAALQAAKDHTDTAIGELPAPPVTSVAGRTGAVTLTKADVGLSGVDNVKQATKSEFDVHIGNINNPHSVTKEQVGLGNVPNYGAASQAQAEAGADNATFMTPQSARHAIDARTRYGTTTGTGTAYILTLTPALSSLYTGIEIKAKMHTSNTGAATLNINGLGAKSLRNNEGTAFGAGDLEAGRIYTFVYDGINFTQVSGGGDYVRIDFDNYILGEKTPSYLGFGAVPNLTNSETFSTGVSTDKHALFSGGRFSASSRVYTYNENLIAQLAPNLDRALFYIVGGRVGDYTLFSGGIDSGVAYNIVYAYNDNLVKTLAPNMSIGRYFHASASVGNYAIFSGGRTESNGSQSNLTEAYNGELVRTNATQLSISRFNLAGCSSKNHALFAGGGISTGSTAFSSAVDAYSESLVRTTLSNLSITKTSLSGTRTSNHALFAGGDVPSGDGRNVDAYASNLTKIIAPDLIEARSMMGATSLGEHGMFVTGTKLSSYNKELIVSSINGISPGRYGITGATVKDKYALFAGGNDSSNSPQKNVNGFNISAKNPSYEQFITIGSKYNFDGTERTAVDNKITVPNPATGYIKFKKGVLS